MIHHLPRWHLQVCHTTVYALLVWVAVSLKWMGSHVNSSVEETVNDNKTHEKAARGVHVSARLAYVGVAAAVASVAKVSGLHWE